MYTLQPKKLYKISQLIERNLIDLDDLDAIVPGVLHINSIKDFAFEYISKRGLTLLGYSYEELYALGAKVFQKHQSVYTLKTIYPKLFEEIAKGDRMKVFSFLQDWQHTPYDKPFYLFTTSKILNDKQLLSISLFPKDIENVCRKVDRLFGLNKTMELYFNKYYSLTKREREILELLGKELSRKEISNLLFISPRTVKKHSENLFRKLGTHKRVDLKKINTAFSSA